MKEFSAMAVRFHYRVPLNGIIGIDRAFVALDSPCENADLGGGC